MFVAHFKSEKYKIYMEMIENRFSKCIQWFEQLIFTDAAYN